LGIISVKIVFESHFLIIMSPSCGLNSCLAVKNLNIHDKSTSMSRNYGMNEHIQGFRYQCQYSIYSQVSSRGSISVVATTRRNGTRSLLTSAKLSNGLSSSGDLQENSTRSLFLIRVLYIQNPHGPCY